MGTAVGLALLMPAYAIGGMGAGDVKLLAGVGSWVWGTHTFYAFAVSTLVGGVIAIGMILWKKSWTKHKDQFWPSRFYLEALGKARPPQLLLAHQRLWRQPRHFL